MQQILKHKKLIIISGIALVAIYLIGMLVRKQPTPITVEPTRPTPQPGEVVDLIDKITPGLTSEEEILDAFGEPISEESIGNTKVLSYDSGYVNYPNKIKTVNETVVLVEKQEKATGENDKTIKDYLPNPTSEPVIKYLRGRGETTPLYIYPQDGMAFVAHISDQVVFESWKFSPTDINSALALWGQDLVDVESVEVTF